MIRKRTLGVTLLALLVLLFASVNLARLVQAIQKWQFLSELLPIWPGYLLISGFVWFIVGVWLFWKLWTSGGVGYSLLIAIVLYSINLWLEKFWLAFTGGISEADNNWPFFLMVNLLVIAWSIWELYRPGLRQVNEERYEQQSEG